MSNEFKKSGKLSYLPQYNHKDDSETEATIIEVVNRRKPQKKKYKIDKSKVVSLVFRAIYLVLFIATAVAVYKATNGQFLFTESYSEILDSQHIVGGSAIMCVFIIILERLVVFYVENFMD